MPASPPAHYGNPTAEYKAARNGAVLRDASHLGRLRIDGADHLDFLHRMSTNDFKGAAVGSGFEAVFTDSRGRILEVGTFYRFPDRTEAILAPDGQQRLPAWLDRYLFSEKVGFAPAADDEALLEVSGPRAAAWVKERLDIDVEGVENLHLLATEAPLSLARHDFGGHPGLRAWGSTAEVAALRQKLQDAGASPLGEEIWEILRIENGLPAHGRELTDEHNPWEADLAHAVHMNKGCYIGQEVIARLDSYAKVKQRLRGLLLPPGPLPAPDTALYAEGRPIGRLCSAVYSPGLERPIALAYVRRDCWAPGTRLHLDPGQGDASAPAAEVVELPFSPAR